MDESDVDSEYEAFLYSQIHHEPVTHNENLLDLRFQKVPDLLSENIILPGEIRLGNEGLGSVPNLETEGRKIKNCKLRHEPSFCDKPGRSLIKVLFDQDLTPEKQNRTKPVRHTPINPIKVLKGLKKIRSRTSSLNSTTSEDDIKTCGITKRLSKNITPLINVSSSDSSVTILDSNCSQADKDLWRISLEDQFKTEQSRPKSRFDFITCYNCREKGHLSKSCRKPKRIISCFLCGQQGHSGENCLNPICSQCLLPGHTQAACLWKPRNNPNCPLCRSKGHLCQECPSLWRRYHLTTTPEMPLQDSHSLSQPSKESKYCYNCGFQGHFGYACNKKRQNPNIFPTNRRVTDYTDPKTNFFHKLPSKYVKCWERKLLLAEKSRVSGRTPGLPLRHRVHDKPKAKRKRLQVQLFDRTDSNPQINVFRKPKLVKHDNLVKISPSAETIFPRKYRMAQHKLLLNNGSLKGKLKQKEETRKQRKKRSREEKKTWNSLNRLVDQFI